MKSILKIFIIGLLLQGIGFCAPAVKKGTLSVIVFSDGKPLYNNEVEIDGKHKLRTDYDGFAHIRLPVGGHQVQIIGKNRAGINLGFIKKNAKVIEGKDTQIIATFSESGERANVDTPVKSLENNNSKKIKSSGFGTLVGRIVSSQGSKPIEGARIFVRGTSIDTRTDASGRFSAKIPSGTEVSISVVHSAYSAQTINGITVDKDQSVSKTIKLTPASMELEEFVVLAPKIEGSVSDVIMTEKKNDVVGNVLGSEQFTKSGDSSAASALKRVSGITIVGGKYVYVRGLGDRYSTVMFNGLHLPSPEPTKRVVPLDIFPTSVIKSMTIQKAFTGDIPGTFGGGTVLIESKDIPKKPFAKLSFGLSGNSSTGENVMYNKDNEKALPSSVIKASEGGTNFDDRNDHKLTNDVLTYRSLNHDSQSLPIGTSIGFALGDTYDVTDDLRAGASATMFYKSSADSTQKEYQKHIYDLNARRVFTDSKTTADQTSLRSQKGLMFNMGLNYRKHHSLKYSYFLIDDIKDTSTLAKIHYLADTEDRDKTYYEYVEKKVSTHQLSGESNILFAKKEDGYLDNLKINWAVEHAEASRDEPGTVESNYLHQTAGLRWVQKTWYYYFILNDKVDNYRADFTLPFKHKGNDNYTKAGVFIYNKTRDFDSRRFKIGDKSGSITGIDLTKPMDNIYANADKGDVLFEPAYQDSDSYNAKQDVHAFYLSQLYSITHNLDLIASARYENSSQQLTDAKTGKPYDPLETTDILPGLGLTYRFDDDRMQLRTSAARTLTRPDFREFSPNRYKDPITENIVFGNPDLKSTAITHLDLKYEWYPSADELFSVALFGKNFENPIEKVVRKNDAQGNEMEQSYTNAKSATSFGVELDLRKRFGFLGERWENLLFTTNYAWISSNITIDRDAFPYFTKRLTTTDRAMQGQSPYVVNFSLGYDNPDTGDSALLLYNEIGESIDSLGTDGNKDIYLQPFSKLDFVTKWHVYGNEDSLLNYYVSFKASNLLDSTMEFTQGDLTTQTFKPGRSFSLKFDIKY